MSPHPLTSQRGAATLAITLMLAFVVLLSVAFANRSMLFEAKTSANQYHAAQAYEAAEAGLDWCNSTATRQSATTAYRIPAVPPHFSANEAWLRCKPRVSSAMAVGRAGAH